jgi:hypothetical protein
MQFSLSLCATHGGLAAGRNVNVHGDVVREREVCCWATNLSLLFFSLLLQQWMSDDDDDVTSKAEMHT